MTLPARGGDATAELLKSKAMLLLRREQELGELRDARDRVESWLNVFYSLSNLLGITDEGAILSESAAMLIDSLGFEVVAAYSQWPDDDRLYPTCVRPTDRSAVPIAPEPADPLLGASQGTHEDGEISGRIGEATGLEKFFWLAFPAGKASRRLLVAGFSPHSAPFHTLSGSDLGHFVMFGYHLAALLSNAHLVEEVSRERAELTDKHRQLEVANRRLVGEMEERERIEAELRLAQKLEAVGQLAAGIAHEINTPMQYIGDNIEFLRTAATRFDPVAVKLAEVGAVTDPDERAALLEAVVVDAEKARLPFLRARVWKAINNSMDGVAAVARIVRAMRDFSHPGTDAKQEVDLNRAIDSSITVTRNEWKYVADVEFTPDPDLPTISGFPGELNQVFLNLIINAAHAIETRAAGAGSLGTISFTTSFDDDWVELRVSDDGTGIRPEVVDKIFTPFFTTKEVGKGTGQGLAIARSVVVDAHAGCLDVESTVGEGTTFIIRLPRAGCPA